VEWITRGFEERHEQEKENADPHGRPLQG